MNPKVIDWNPNWGQFSEEVMREVLQKEGYGVARYSYKPGTYYPLHGHGVDKKEAVLAGRLRISWEGGEAVLKPGQMIEIQAGFRHSARVLGTETVISLDASRSVARKPQA